MQYTGVNELREMFLSFFESKGKDHLRMASSSLIPHNDKSLLLINSGMAPLKPFFTGSRYPLADVLPPARSVSAQAILKTWAKPHVTAPFLRCSATFRLATTSRERLYTGHGSFLPR